MINASSPIGQFTFHVRHESRASSRADMTTLTCPTGTVGERGLAVLPSVFLVVGGVRPLGAAAVLVAQPRGEGRRRARLVPLVRQERPAALRFNNIRLSSIAESFESRNIDLSGNSVFRHGSANFYFDNMGPWVFEAVCLCLGLQSNRKHLK